MKGSNIGKTLISNDVWGGMLVLSAASRAVTGVLVEEKFFLYFIHIAIHAAKPCTVSSVMPKIIYFVFCY